MNMNPPPDFSKVLEQEVVYWAQKAHKKAQDELYRRYKGPVRKLLFQMFDDDDVAEELTQVTFVKVFEGLQSYNPELKFSSWIFAIANHVGLDDRRKKPLDTLSLDDSPLITSPSGKIRGIQVAATTDSTPNPVRLWRELGPDVEQGIARLRPDYRQCITLRFRQGKSYLEIARIMHLPIGTVASNLLRALEQLREMLGPKLDSSRSDPPPPNPPRSDSRPPPTA